MLSSCSNIVYNETNKSCVKMRHKNSNMQMYFIVTIFATAIYCNSLSGEFVHDDLPAILYNDDVLGKTNFIDIVFNDFWGTPMKNKHSHKSYRPLTTLTFRINRIVFGIENAFSFHVVNVILHGVSTILFTKISSTIVGFKNKFAILCGIIFALHPIHTESVSGIVGRAELLGCIFFSLSFLYYHGSRKDPNNRSLLLSILFGGLAMLSKESGLTVFIVNLLYDFFRNWSVLKKTIQDVRWSNESYRFAKRMFCVSVSMSMFLVARLAVLQGSLPIFSQQDNPAAFHSSFQTRFLTFLYLSSFNFWLLICPANLSHDWQMGSIPLILNIGDVRNLLTLCTVVTFASLLIKIYNDLGLKHHVPVVLGFILLIFPFVLPASNLLVTVGFVLAERILFIPSMGFCILVIYGTQIIYKRIHHFEKIKWIFKISGLILLSFLCLKTVKRNLDWQSRESLLKSGLKVLPNNAKLHFNYGNFLRDGSNFALAKSHYKKALELWPTYASAWNNLGTLIEDDINLQEKHFLAAVHFSEQHINAHFNLGQLYRKSNRSFIATEMFKKCILYDENFIPAYIGLSKIRRGISSGILLRKALERNNENLNVRLEYADWLYSNNFLEDAYEQYIYGAGYSGNLQLSFISGAMKTLRQLGRKEKMLQVILRWQIIKRINIHKSVNQLYLRDWSMRNEILKKAQMYETSILHPTKELKSNNTEARGLQESKINEKMNLFMTTPLHDSDNMNAILKPHCNRSGVYISIKGTNFCDIIIPDHPDDEVVASSVETLISLKTNSEQRPKQNKNISKLQENEKEKAILEERIQSLISIDKL